MDNVIIWYCKARLKWTAIYTAYREMVSSKSDNLEMALHSIVVRPINYCTFTEWNQNVSITGSGVVEV